MTRDSARHIPALDGIRGLAILLVILFHLVQGSGVIRGSLPSFVVKGSSLGQLGVDLFFVLSGFLITGILIDTRDDPRYFRNFFGRRTIRIFPLYFSALAILLTLPKQWISEVGSAEASPWWMWTYLSNVPPTYLGTSVRFPHFWSLAVEEQFYLGWPFLIWFVRPKWIVWTCVCLLISAPICRALFIHLGYSPFYSVFTRLDSLAAGALLAAVSRSGGLLPGQIFRRTAVVAAVAVVVGGVSFPFLAGTGAPWIQVVKHTLAAAIFVTVIASVLGDDNRLSSRFFELPLLRWFGKYSYCLYIVHPVFIVVAARTWGKSGQPDMVGAVIISATVFASAAITSQLTWRAIEQPCLRLKTYFRYKSD